MGVFCPYSIEVLQFLMINHTAPATPKTDELTSLLHGALTQVAGFNSYAEFLAGFHSFAGFLAGFHSFVQGF